MSTDPERYARHLALPDVGSDGQGRLAAATMLVVGIGGLGCPAAQYLASSGVGRLILNDFDCVDRSNLPRQILFGEVDVGARKVDAAAASLRRLNPAVSIETIAERLSEAGFLDAVQRADVVLDCTDNFGTRLALNRAAVTARKPLVSGAALRFEGQLAVFSNNPGDPCFSCVYSEDHELLGDCVGNGVLAPVPGVIGCMMAVEALGLVIRGHSEHNARLSLWDAVAGAWQTIDLAPDPDCPVCGKSLEQQQ
jgi:molybdopterin/thiamine biosynthesis adenylyltransferase